MQRLCPRDRSVLVEQRVEGLNVDVCAICFGSFFDGIELRRIAGQKDLALKLGDAHGRTDAPLVCCACGDQMHLDTVQGIQLDHCANCLGVWLDAGELDRLAAPSTSPSTAVGHAMALERALRDVAAKLQRSR